MDALRWPHGRIPASSSGPLRRQARSPAPPDATLGLREPSPCVWEQSHGLAGVGPLARAGPRLPAVRSTPRHSHDSLGRLWGTPVRVGSPSWPRPGWLPLAPAGAPHARLSPLAPPAGPWSLLPCVWQKSRWLRGPCRIGPAICPPSGAAVRGLGPAVAIPGRAPVVGSPGGGCAVLQRLGQSVRCSCVVLMSSACFR